jgi:adenylate cyclase
MVQAQGQISEWNGQWPADYRLHFRIGMGRGSVLTENNEIYGSTVNEAARLQEIAKPGQILVSGEVFDSVRNGIDVGFDYLGERALKGLTHSTRVYEVFVDPSAIGRVMGKRESKTPGLRWALPSITVALIVIAGLVAQGLRPEPEWINVRVAGGSTSVYPLFEKPAINFPRFDYVGGDPEFQYVLEGFAESLAGSLARYSNLRVLVFGKPEVGGERPWKGQREPEQKLSRFRVRVTAWETERRVDIKVRLTDALSARNWIGHWSVESAIALASPAGRMSEKISAELRTRILHTVYKTFSREDTDSAEVFDLAMRGLEIYWRFTKRDNKEAQRIFVEVTSLDPDFVKAWLALAWTYFNEARFGWSDTPDVALSRARELALRISAYDEFNAQAEALMAAVNRSRKATLN